jgi:recombination protein RecA
MARATKRSASKSKAGVISDDADITFSFFKQEIEKDDDVSVISGEQLGNPLPNKTGSLSLDYDLVLPIPEGRITEVFGPESTCKTTLVLSIAAQAIMKGKKVLYVNMEKNLNESLLRTIRGLRPYLDAALAGENECPLWIINATTGEQALEAMRKFASMVPDGIAILDSIDAAQPEAVLSGEIGENKVGNLAKLMSDAMRKLINVSETNNVSLVFVNQTRDKITMYGDPTTTSGGSAIRFYASQRIRLKKPRKDDFIKDDDGEVIGVKINYVVAKNKVAPDGNEGVFPVLFKNGIWVEFELIAKCCHLGILKMGGKGGKQVYLPILDRETGDYVMDGDERKGVCMKQFNAARRLLLDEKLADKLTEELYALLDPSEHAVDSITDEI